MDNNAKAGLAEKYVAFKLEQAGVGAMHMSHIRKRGMPDFITDGGIAIDVKYATKDRRSNAWRFNCHHHGIKQNNIDYFIFVYHTTIQGFVSFVVPAALVRGRNFQIGSYKLKRESFMQLKDNYTSLIILPSANKKILARRAKMLRLRDEALSKLNGPNKIRSTYEDRLKKIRRRLKMSKARKGRIASAETRAKQSTKRRLYWRNAPPEKHKRSEATRLKMSIARKQYYERLWAEQAQDQCTLGN